MQKWHLFFVVVVVVVFVVAAVVVGSGGKGKVDPLLQVGAAKL